MSVFRDELLLRFPGFPEEKIALLQDHFQLLLKWNRVLNLTSIKNIEEAVERHYCESLFLGLQLPPGAVSIADVGSGAGFPGLPIAVLRPECTVNLIESHQRKAVFLREASRHLSNVRVESKRAEEVTGRFDVVISRAVSYLDLESSLNRLTSFAMLLTGGEAPPNSLGFFWNKSIALPWGNQRFLRIGTVSRET